MITPVVDLTISGQLLDFLIDINGVESYLVKKGTPGRRLDIGFDDSRNDYKNLNKLFAYMIGSGVNVHGFTAYGNYSQATRLGPDFSHTVSFGLINKVEGEPNIGTPEELPHAGRIGYNWWMGDQETTLASSWLAYGGEQPVFAWVSGCSKE